MGSGEQSPLKIHKGIDNYFSCDVPSVFVRMIEALQNKLRNAWFWFLEEFLKAWHKLQVGYLVKFTREAIWSWTFLSRKFLVSESTLL